MKLKLYVAVYDDGDYYCEGMHIVGIYDSKEKAVEGVQEYKDTAPKYRYSYTYEIIVLEINKTYS